PRSVEGKNGRAGHGPGKRRVSARRRRGQETALRIPATAVDDRQTASLRGRAIGASFRMRLTFAGAADTVTGSRHLLDTGEARILVDCGLFQGFKKLRERNWRPFPVPPRSIGEVVLSHAHLDH